MGQDTEKRSKFLIIKAGENLEAGDTLLFKFKRSPHHFIVGKPYWVNSEDGQQFSGWEFAMNEQGFVEQYYSEAIERGTAEHRANLQLIKIRREEKKNADGHIEELIEKLRNHTFSMRKDQRVAFASYVMSKLV